jgi:signal transduction histidine kinase
LADASGHVRERLHRLQRAAERAGQLIERHLQLQRLSRADFALSRTSVAPAAPAEAALSMAGESFPSRKFDFFPAADLPAQLAMDAELVTLALLNLLSNAAKYSPPATPVCLTIDGAMLRYGVRDLGPGIPEADRDRVFEMFGRASSADGPTGFGIGLALACRVAKLHAGSLDHARSAPVGTLFTLAIPAIVAMPEARES